MTVPIYRLCPKCGGAGRAGAVVVTDKPPIWIDCETCHGTSVVTDDEGQPAREPKNEGDRYANANH